MQEACISADKTMQGIQKIRRDGLKTVLAKLYPFGPGPWISIWLRGFFRVLS